MPLSISAGCARFPKDGVTVEELVVAADARMYQDKAERRAVRSHRIRASESETEFA